MAHNNYTVAEIGEAVLNDSSFNTNDMTAQEQSRRKVREWAMFPQVTEDEVLNNGIKTRVKVKFSVGDGGNIVIWCMNVSGGTLTSGAKIRVFGTIYSKKF